MSKKFLIIFISYFLLILVWDLFLFYIPAKTNSLNYLYNVGYSVLYLIGGFAGLVGAWKISWQSTVGKAVGFLGLGNLSYGIGLVIWAYYNLALKIDVPYPSVVDIFMLGLFIPFIFIGIIFFLRIFRTYVSLWYIGEAIVIFGLTLVLIFKFINQPDVSGNLDLITRIVNVAYPLADAILIALAYITLRIAGGKINQGMLLLIAGLVCQIIADFIFSIRSANDIYWNGDWADTLFTFSGTLLSLAIVNIVSQFSSDFLSRQKA